ncbi:MAG: DUF2062 domain-containing protein [Verrucomicrobiota bacterium]|nr:DUF2062 domain-containing protein [Verrucomicrobiota bacterium]
MTLSDAPKSKRTVWQRRIIDPLVSQLTQGITPEKIALTIAVGGACGLFPILGMTTLLCFVVAIILRLNQPIIQLLNQALWPVHLLVIPWYLRLGEVLFGIPHQRLFIREMHRLLSWDRSMGLGDNVARFFDNLIEFFQKFGPTAFHAIIAWVLLAPLFIVICYYSLLPVMQAIDRIRQEQKAKLGKDSTPSI